MKQIITTLVICISITTVNAGNFSNNSILKNHLKIAVPDNVFKPVSKRLVVLPNPKTGDIQVSFRAEKAGKATIIVLDESGATVLKQKVQLVAGKNNININNFNDLAEGDYTVCLNTNYGAYSSPFLLWK
jgi:Secretion system C-terminal sorting domain